MKKHIILISAIIFTSAIGMNCQAQKKSAHQPAPTVKKQLIPGEQAPPADAGQNNFGGPRPAVGAQGAARPVVRPPRPEPEIKTVSLDEISMSDPFIYPDEKSHTYYLTSSGGRLYKSKDLKMWTGPYNVIDLAGTWMNGLFPAAAEIPATIHADGGARFATSRLASIRFLPRAREIRQWFAEPRFWAATLRRTA